MQTRTMRIAMGFAGAAVAALVAVPSAAAECPFADAQPTAANLPEVRAAVSCLHNEERRASGVAPLRRHRLLERAAGAHSEDMVARLFFSNETPESLDPFQRMEAAGYIRNRAVWNAGENIAWGSGSLSTPRSIFEAWMNSPSHRLTLLAGEFTRLGVGIALGAPSPDHPRLEDAVTYTVDFGWRQARSADGQRPRKPRRRSRNSPAR